MTDLRSHNTQVIEKLELKDGSRHDLKAINSLDDKTYVAQFAFDRTILSFYIYDSPKFKEVYPDIQWVISLIHAERKVKLFIPHILDLLSEHHLHLTSPE